LNAVIFIIQNPVVTVVGTDIPRFYNLKLMAKERLGDTSEVINIAASKGRMNFPKVDRNPDHQQTRPEITG